MLRKHAEADVLYQPALAIKEQALGANHPAVALTLDNLAMLEDRRGDIAKALACSRKATAASLRMALPSRRLSSVRWLRSLFSTFRLPTYRDGLTDDATPGVT
jgi:Tetratricopeptide repeat